MTAQEPQSTTVTDKRSDDPVMNTLESLSRQYGTQTVTNELARLSFEAAVGEADLIREALIDERPDQLQNLSRPAMAYLSALANETDRNAVLAGLKSLAVSEQHASLLLDLWSLAQKHSATAITGRKAYVDTHGHDIFTADSIQDIQARLFARRDQIEVEQAALLAGCEPILASLQSAYLSGTDVREQLLSVNAVDDFQQLLSLLAETQAYTSPLSQPSSPIRQAVLRYTPLIKFWRDLRLEMQGRINHWVHVKTGRYYNIHTNYPQVELHLFSNTKEIFHTRDDIDDVLKLSALIFRTGVEAIADLQKSGASIPDNVTQSIAEILDAVEGDSATLRLALQRSKEKENGLRGED